MPSLYKNGIPTSAGVAVFNRLWPLVFEVFLAMTRRGLDPSEVAKTFHQCVRDAETRAWGQRNESEKRRHRDAANADTPPAPVPESGGDA